MGLLDFLKTIWLWEPKSGTRKYTGSDGGTNNNDYAPVLNSENSNSNSDSENFRGHGGDFEGGGSEGSWNDSSDSSDGGDSGGDSGGDGGGGD